MSVLLVTLTLACGQSGPPQVDGLRDSFASQIASIELVQDFAVEGDELTFKRADGSGDVIEWRVVIDELSVEPQEDEAAPFRGVVSSSWFLNGQLIRATATASHLPMWILEAGISQECWAFWDPETRTWGWT